MPSRERVRDLVAYVERGRILEAIDEFYADDVVMQDNHAPPTVGKAANREREQAFAALIAEVHENRAAAVLVDGDRAVINWRFDFTGTDGTRYRFDQLAFQSWKGDRIVNERFYYDSATLVVGEAKAA
jgi:ketosteroid isomerase-like protein